MAVYTVHIKGSGAGHAALERALFVREGFTWSAFIFGPVWLLAHREWLGLVLWLAVQGLIVIVALVSSAGADAVVALELLTATFLGLEGSQLRQASLARQGYVCDDIVAGETLADAERRYFARSLAGSSTGSGTPLMAATPLLDPGLVGLFPSARS